MSAANYASRLINSAKTKAAYAKGYGAEVKREGVLGGSMKMVDDAFDSVTAPYVDTLAAGAKTMVKRTDRSFWNGYTGLRESKIGAGVAIAGSAAYVGLASNYQIQTAPKLGDSMQRMNEAPIHTYDGVSSTTSAPTLGASGSMVFGMHNARKG